jgi:pullulanase
VLFGIKGGVGVGVGWTVEDSMVINYMSAHDNNTLWDKLILSNPTYSDELRLKMNKLGAAILMVSKGTPFWQAGEEMLRTKDGDENSYKSSDAVNNIDWSVLDEGNIQYEAMLYYKGLIEMRKAFSIFTSPNSSISSEQIGNKGAVAITIEELDGKKALIIINPTETNLTYSLNEEWNLIADSERASSHVLSRESGDVSVDYIGVKVYVNDALIKE